MTNTAVLATSSVNVNSTDQPFADCIKNENRFTEVRYHNICTGEVSTVPTGLFDYLIGVPVVVMAIFVAIFVVVMIIRAIRN